METPRQEQEDRSLIVNSNLVNLYPLLTNIVNIIPHHIRLNAVFS